MNDVEKVIVDHYNLLANQLGLPRCRLWTKARAAKLRQRAADCDGDYSMILEAIDKLADSAFCQGDNERGWKATLDFVLQASSFTKLLEGAYDDRIVVTKTDRLDDILEKWKNEQRESDGANDEADKVVPLPGGQTRKLH
jgi:hypothetical protein